MSHEQSETIERDGKFYNIYGRNTPRAGEDLPGEPAYDTLDAAVSGARARSNRHGMDSQERLAKLRRLAELKAMAGGDASQALPPSDTLTDPPEDAPNPSTAPYEPSTKGYRTGALDQTLKEIGENASPIDKARIGILSSGEQTARAFMIPQALRALGVNLDPEGDTALEKADKGTGPLGSVGGLVGTLAQAIPIGARLAAGAAKVLPEKVMSWLAENPKLAAYLGSAGTSAGTAGLMTPGGLEERGKEALTAAAVALPMTAAVRTAAKPIEMSDIGQQIKAATGEIPPVSIGAKSKMLRDVGYIEKNLPIVGGRIEEGERRVFDAGVKQLWAHATPPGMPNLVEHASEVKRGPIFSQLENQFDQTYTSLLKGQRIPTTNADRQALNNLVDKDLVPADAAKVHDILNKYFPQGNFMGGETWKELQGIIRSKAAKFNRSTDEADKLVGQTLDKVDGYLIKMRNKSVPKSVRQKLDETDRAHQVRELIEDAISSKGGEKGLTPEMLATALRSRTSDAVLAKGQGVGQPLIDPLSATLGNMPERTLPSALWGAGKVLGLGSVGGVAGGVPGFLAGSLPIAAPIYGASAKGAATMFGERAGQKALADMMRKYPSGIPSTAAGLEVQSQE